MAAARRIPLERPPSQADEKKMLRLQDAMKVRIGEHVKKLRIEANLSLRQMAMRANVSPTYLSEVERAKRSVSVEFLVRMGYVLNVSPTLFLSEET
jgi:predicted transcriptional regulator